MNNYKVPAIFGIAIMAIGLFTVSGFSMSPSASQTGIASAGMPMMGHIEMVAKHSDGTIYAYRQTDNVVVAVGKTCTGMLVFGTVANTTGSTNTSCGAGGNGKFQAIGLGVGSGSAGAGDTELFARAATAATTVSNIGLINGSSTVSAMSILSNTFTMANGSQTITEAGLFDNTAKTQRHMFAHQTFTGIPVNANDQLTLKWTVNLG